MWPAELHGAEVCRECSVKEKFTSAQDRVQNMQSLHHVHNSAGFLQMKMGFGFYQPKPLQVSSQEKNGTIPVHGWLELATTRLEAKNHLKIV